MENGFFIADSFALSGAAAQTGIFGNDFSGHQISVGIARESDTAGGAVLTFSGCA